MILPTQFSKNVCMYNCTLKKPILIFFSSIIKHSVHANIIKSLYTKKLCKASNVNVVHKCNNITYETFSKNVCMYNSIKIFFTWGDFQVLLHKLLQALKLH